MSSLLRRPNYYNSFSPSIRMSGKSIIFGNKKFKKSDFYKKKKVIKIDDNKILV